MAVGLCAVAVALSLFALPCVHAARDQSSTLEAVNVNFSGTFIGCVVPSTTKPARSLTLEKQVGSGAEGEVYKAKDQSGRYAAVKLLRQGKSLDVKEVSNLEALSKVKSRHINNLEEDFQNVRECCGMPGMPGRPCLVTEFIAGRDAAKIMWENGIRSMRDVNAGKANRGALSYKLLCSILLQSLAGFRDTEKAQLCNYDQHLRNVMFEEATERIVFIDFGMANSMANSPVTKCPPKGPFKDESLEKDTYSLQSFRSLAYLLADDGDRQAYLALCTRLAGNTYASAEQALFSEAFASYPCEACEPGAFFSLHPDDNITQQLQALLNTGDPYIGKVSGKGPWQDDVVETGQSAPKGTGFQQPPQKQHPLVLQPINTHIKTQHLGHTQHHAPQQPPSNTVVSRVECCREGACILQNGRCLDKKQGYVIDSSTCASKFGGQWCN